MSSKPIPPPPPIMESRLFGPKDPIIAIRKGRGAYTVRRTGRPGNESAEKRRQENRVNYRELMRAPGR